MKRLLILTLFSSLFLVEQTVNGQDNVAGVLWQVTTFDIVANVELASRTLNATATIKAVNIGRDPGKTLTARLNSKGRVTSATVNGAVANFRMVPETRGDVQRVTVMLPSAVGPNIATSITIVYSMPVESNNGLAAVSPTSSQLLPLSFWYPMPNTPFTSRGADTAPFHLSVNLPNAISSGIDKGVNGGSNYEQPLYGQPFFVQGDWDKLDGSGDGKGITVMLPKGAPAVERKQADTLLVYAAAARNFFTSQFGPGPDIPIRIVAVNRGAGFSDAGTVLVEADALRRQKIDAATALAVAEAVARLWIGTQTAVRGEGAGVLHDSLVRFIATQFLEKQFGREAAQSELARERSAYAAVAKRDGPLSVATQLDSTYFASVPNRGAMVWRLIDRRLGHDAFMSILKNLLQSGRADVNGLSLAALRAALADRGGVSVKALMDQQFGQIVDTDLMVGLPQQRGAEWIAALRNLGSTDVTVTVVATTDRGEKVTAETAVAAKSFAEANFKTNARVVRVEVDPEKLIPQIDFGNDSAPRTRDAPDSLATGSLALAAQDFAKAENAAREILTTSPQVQEARILLGRALLAENKLDEAERVFRSALDDALPTSATLAWGSIGLGEVRLRQNKPAEAVLFFSDAVHAGGDYASSLAARAERIKAEAAANTAPPVDESVRAFIRQLDQSILSGKKAELTANIVSGELVKFVNGIVGTQPEIWETRVLRTEQLDASLFSADVAIHAKQLGQEGSGTAVFLVSRTAGGLKLSGIELFEVR
ncbi:MAG: tetratricopeptide repeat protein [Pyrinomonadaceae bacterium]